ncbi:MAG: hypothetical protein J1E83_12665 [Lachnospiraceae bacterium]|nr:hypothetical protein [Lachnospiraceae bacterium]
MPYIDWEYYSSLFTEITEETDFNRYATRAAAKLDAITHMRAKRFWDAYRKTKATDFQKMVHNQIQLTLCELVNALYVQDSSGMGTGVSSVSNDGYSESYKVTTAAEKEAQLYSIVRSGLSGTGLVGAL